MKSFSETTKREIEVAFSKHSQPIWFRIVKYIVLGVLVYSLWGNDILWIVLVVLLLLSLCLHFWYRFKTRGWTQSYRGWKFHSKMGQKKEQE